MDYCSRCEKHTNSNKKEISFNKYYNLVILTCEECQCFKEQYLEEKVGE